MSKCECSCCPCCSEVADHCRWVMGAGDQSQFVLVFNKMKCSFMMRKQASRLPEAAETVDTVQPAGGHSADQHKNNSATVVENPPMEERGRIRDREPSCRFAAAGKKLNKSWRHSAGVCSPHAAEIKCLLLVLSRPAGYEHQLYVKRFAKRRWPERERN